MVEVEDTSHGEEGQVVETPPKKQPPTRGQEPVDVACKIKISSM